MIRVPPTMRLGPEAAVREVSSCAEVGGPFSIERSFGEAWCGACGHRVAEHAKTTALTFAESNGR